MASIDFSVIQSEAQRMPGTTTERRFYISERFALTQGCSPPSPSIGTRHPDEMERGYINYCSRQKKQRQRDSLENDIPVKHVLMSSASIQFSN